LFLSVGDIKHRYVVGEMARDPPVRYLGFTARMIISDRAGYQPVFGHHTAHVACRFAKLIQRTDRWQEKTLADPQKWIRRRMQPSPAIETFREYATLWRFAVRGMKQAVAVGAVRVVEKKQAEAKKSK
jgi:elongation factor 1-alpha